MWKLIAKIASVVWPWRKSIMAAPKEIGEAIRASIDFAEEVQVQIGKDTPLGAKARRLKSEWEDVLKLITTP